MICKIADSLQKLLLFNKTVCMSLTSLSNPLKMYTFIVVMMCGRCVSHYPSEIILICRFFAEVILLLMLKRVVLIL